VFNVGLTGNVASGKSTVLRHFRDWGATTIDADKLVRAVQQPGSAVVRDIGDRFGSEIITRDGSLDRGALRRLVMGDPAALADLNAIVHPAVRRKRDELAAVAARRGDLVVVNDIPLLFEALDPRAFDLIVLVDTPESVRRDRLIATRDLSTSEADRLLRSQQPTEAKRARSHVIIQNHGTLGDLEQAAREAWHTVRTGAARQAAGKGGSLLVVVAHPADAPFAVGGTLARYADAGCAVHVISMAAAPRPPAGSLHPTVIWSSLATFSGAFDRSDTTVTQRLTDRIRAEDPAVLVTFGPDGMNGHPDHQAVHAWVDEAWSATGSSAALYYIASPSVPEPPAQEMVSALAADGIAAGVDIRPWSETKRSAVRDLPPACGLVGTQTLATALQINREWYRAREQFGAPLWDLFAVINGS
jgi:dephospho-CoA kinase